MQKLLIILLFVLGLVGIAHAQVAPTTQPLPTQVDNRQAIHRLFKGQRHKGMLYMSMGLGLASAMLVVASSRNVPTGGALIGSAVSGAGAGTAVGGWFLYKNHSRKKERALLLSLEKGEPLPASIQEELQKEEGS